MCSILITGGYEVLVKGNNYGYALGLGHNNYVSSYTKIPEFNAVKYYHKHNTTAFITPDNDVYVCGYSDLYRSNISYYNSKLLVRIPDLKATDMAYGDNITVFLTTDKEVFVCCKSLYSKLGLIKNVPTLIKISESHRVKLVGCIGNKVLYITQDNEIYIIDMNPNGDNMTIINYHNLIFKSMFCKLDETILLTEDNEAYILNTSKRKLLNMLGLSNNNYLTKIKRLNVIQVFRRNMLTVLVTEDYEFYFMGKLCIDTYINCLDYLFNYSIVRNHDEQIRKPLHFPLLYKVIEFIRKKYEDNNRNNK
jgi:hypothetical protein